MYNFTNPYSYRDSTDMSTHVLKYYFTTFIKVEFIRTYLQLN